MNFDWSQIIISVLGVLVLVFGGYAMWLKNLLTKAKDLIMAAYSLIDAGATAEELEDFKIKLEEFMIAVRAIKG
jgi:hypothetical protein